jgi:hypothetical protein
VPGPADARQGSAARALGEIQRRPRDPETLDGRRQVGVVQQQIDGAAREELRERGGGALGVQDRQVDAQPAQGQQPHHERPAVAREERRLLPGAQGLLFPQPLGQRLGRGEELREGERALLVLQGDAVAEASRRERRQRGVRDAAAPRAQPQRDPLPRREAQQPRTPEHP